MYIKCFVYRLRYRLNVDKVSSPLEKDLSQMPTLSKSPALRNTKGVCPQKNTSSEQFHIARTSLSSKFIEQASGPGYDDQRCDDEDDGEGCCGDGFHYLLSLGGGVRHLPQKNMRMPTGY